MTSKPTPEYLAALLGEQSDMFKEYTQVLCGVKKMTPEEKTAWMKRKDELHQKIITVRNQL